MAGRFFILVSFEMSSRDGRMPRRLTGVPTNFAARLTFS
jgi:hypothetical protein